MTQFLRLDAALLRASWPARLAIFIFALAVILAVGSGIDWQSRYEAIAAPERELVRTSAQDLSEIYDGIAAGTVTPSNLRLPEDQWPPLAEYVIDPRDPYQAIYNHYQLADLPPGPIMALAHGVTPLHPNHVLIHSRALHNLFRPGALPERTNPAVLALGRFDLLTVIMVLAPLMAIALLHDAKARETEAGISPILNSVGARTNAVLGARILFRGGLLIGTVAVTVLAAGVVSGAPVGRLALFTVGACAYTAFWVTLTGMIAATIRSAIGSAALGLTLFAVLCLIGPGVAESVARPDGLVQPRALVDAEITALRREWGREGRDDERVQYVAETYWGAPGGVLPDCADHSVAFRSLSANRLADQAFREALASVHGASMTFDRRLDILGALVPPLGFRRAMEEIAGSSAARAQIFEQSVIDYHATWRDRGMDALINCQTWDRAAFEAAPSYAWEEPAPRRTTLSWALAGLGLWGGFGLVLLFRTRKP